MRLQVLRDEMQSEVCDVIRDNRVNEQIRKAVSGSSSERKRVRMNVFVKLLVDSVGSGWKVCAGEKEVRLPK